MIIVSATIDYATAQDRDRAVEGSIRLQSATREGEPGCHAYCFSADPCIDTRIQVFQLWADQQALADHFVHPNYVAMRAVLSESGRVASTSRKYEIAHDEPVYDGNREPRADWFEKA